MGYRIGERRTTRAVEIWLGYKHPTVRHTELSPTGSETSGTDRQSEIVAASGTVRHTELSPTELMGQLVVV